jgi:hypothetical protein
MVHYLRLIGIVLFTLLLPAAASAKEPKHHDATDAFLALYGQKTIEHDADFKAQHVIIHVRGFFGKQIEGLPGQAYQSDASHGLTKLGFDSRIADTDTIGTIEEMEQVIVAEIAKVEAENKTAATPRKIIFDCHSAGCKALSNVLERNAKYRGLTARVLMHGPAIDGSPAADAKVTETVAKDAVRVLGGDPHVVDELGVKANAHASPRWMKQIPTLVINMGPPENSILGRLNKKLASKMGAPKGTRTDWMVRTDKKYDGAHHADVEHWAAHHGSGIIRDGWGIVRKIPVARRLAPPADPLHVTQAGLAYLAGIKKAPAPARR